MYPLEVAIGALVLSEGGDTHPLSPAASSIAAKEVGIDCLMDPSLGPPDIHLESEGESFPFLCPPGILHSP